MLNDEAGDTWTKSDQGGGVHLVHGEVQRPEAEKHHAVPETLHQRGCEAKRSPDETQQLHGGVCVQAEVRSEPQEGGRGQQLLPQGLTAVSQLPTGWQKPVVTIETWK